MSTCLLHTTLCFLTEVSWRLDLWELVEDKQKTVNSAEWTKVKGGLENAGIDPATSRMLSERSTIWANSPDHPPGLSFTSVCHYSTQQQHQTQWGLVFYFPNVYTIITCVMFTSPHLDTMVTAHAAFELKVRGKSLLTLFLFNSSCHVDEDTREMKPESVPFL